MKKFILMLAAVLISVAVFTGCKPDAQFGFVYSVSSRGSADGNVNVNFVSGVFDLNGHADYNFAISNEQAVPEQALQFKRTATLQEGLESEEAVVSDAAKRVQAWVDNNFGVTSAGGTYDIYLNGYVLETLTGIKFSIDKHFSNVNQ